MLPTRTRFVPAVAALTAFVVGLVCAPMASAGITNLSDVESTASSDIPTDVATDPSGNIYVTDQNSDTVLKFNSSGVLQTSFNASSTGTNFANPTALAFTPGGTNLYVADFGNDRIVQIDTLTNTTSVYEDTGVPEPAGIAVFAGNVYFSSVTQHAVYRITGGSVQADDLGNPGTPGNGMGDLRDPWGIDIDTTHGVLYVADSGNHRVQVATLSGAALPASATQTIGSGPASTDGNFSSPLGVDIDEGSADSSNQAPKRLFVSEAGQAGTGDRVQIFRETPPWTSGTWTYLNKLSGFTDAYGVHVTSASPADIFVAELGGNTVKRFANAGPTTTLGDLPAAFSTAATENFTLSASETTLGGGFDCSLDSTIASAGLGGACTSATNYSVGPLSEGSHTVRSRSTDLFGKVGPVASFTWTVDTLAPTVSITGGPSGATNANNDPQFTWTDDGTGTSIASRTCELTNSVTLAVIQSGACTSPKQYTDLPDGPYQFKITVTDQAGNPASATRTFHIDVTSPLVSITTPVPDSNSNAANIGVQFSDPQADPNGSSKISAVDCRIYRTNPIDPVPGYTACNSPGPFTLAVGLPANGGTLFNRTAAYTGLLDGTYQFDIRITDSASNTATASDSWSIDTQSPNTTINNPLPAATTNDPTLNFSSTDPAPSSGGITYQCELTGPSQSHAFQACGPAAAAAPNAGTKSYTDLADGTYTFRVRATDAAGNVDATPASHTWTIDTTKPVITVLFPKPGGRYVSTSTKPHLADYTCVDTPPSTTTTTTVPAGVDDGEQIDISGGTDGGTPKTFTVNCTDAAGNAATPVVINYETFTFKGLLLDDNPTAYYRMNDAIGATVMNDFGPNNYDGEYKNDQDSGPVGISGDGDKARAFFGENGYGYVNGITAPSRYALAAFVRFNDNGKQSVVQHGGAGAIWLGEDQKFHFRPVDWHSTELVSGAPVIGGPGETNIAANTWYFVVGTLGGGVANLYVNGVHMRTGSLSRQPSGTATFYVGYGDKAPWLRGALDEVAYFGLDISADHIYEIWLADPPPVIEAESSGGGSDGGGGDGGGGGGGGDGGSGGSAVTLTGSGYGDPPGTGGGDDGGDAPVDEPSAPTSEGTDDASVLDPSGTWIRGFDDSILEITAKGDKWVGKTIGRATRKARVAGKKRCGLKKGVTAIALKERAAGGYKGEILDPVKVGNTCKTRKASFTAELSEDGNTLTLKKRRGKKKSTELLTRSFG